LKISYLPQLADGPDNGLAAVFLAGHRSQIAADHIVVGLGVPLKGNFLDIGNFIFDERYIQVNRIFGYNFYIRPRLEKQVSDILVKTGNIRPALVNIETHIKFCLIKYISLLKTESLGKLLIGIYGISLPVNVADFILRPFMHRYMGFQALRRRFKH